MDLPKCNPFNFLLTCSILPSASDPVFPILQLVKLSKFSDLLEDKASPIIKAPSLPIGFPSRNNL